MVKINSTTRFSSINRDIILTQTDTTVGFLSQDAEKLAKIKSRPNTKPFIKVYTSFKALCKDFRVPNKKKNLIRRSKKRTFIVNNQAFRVSNYNLNSQILRRTTWFYSTSANESHKSFDREFCEQKSDIIIEDKNTLFEGQSSLLLKINERKMRRLR
ncbi:hypothetical protein [Sulfurimonas sp.]